MKILPRLKNACPSPLNAGLAALSAILLILAFPDFEFWPLAFVALVPLFWAIDREQESWQKSFALGWIFGLIFFTGTCWWLTHAPITYAGMPWLLVYFFLLCATSVVGIFPGIFASLFSVLLKRFGSYAILFAPFLWIFTEFLRMWLTGNNWNAIGYSQAFSRYILNFASFGGVYLVGFLIVLSNSFLLWLNGYLKKELGINILTFYHPVLFLKLINKSKAQKVVTSKQQLIIIAIFLIPFLLSFLWVFIGEEKNVPPNSVEASSNTAFVIAVQPNVPMNGLSYEKYQRLLQRHVQLAEEALKKSKENPSSQIPNPKSVVIFPESPMIFLYGRDLELQEFLRQFAVRNNTSVLFNSAELTDKGERAFNSAVMINEKGEKVAQYDKIHLLPFGEFIPFPEPLASMMPAFVGNFEHGSEYDLLPLGEAKGGVMICFESHFGELSREYARRGADVLIEMTNDGYLGKTPVLRQHLANSVFRAVETNRPVLRVTNVGVTALINEKGVVSDAADVYTEATRVWAVSKSDGSQTIYVKYGDWFAWLCSIVSLALLFLSFRKRKN